MSGRARRRRTSLRRAAALLAFAAGSVAVATPAASASAVPAHHEMRPMWVVGSEQHPLFTRGAPGPLWKVPLNAAAAPVPSAGHAAMRMAAGDGAPELLTTREATKRLSRRCQRLIKARRSKLTRAERRARLTCVRQRRRLVTDALAALGLPTPPTTPPAAGSTAPAGPTAAPGTTPTPTPAPAPSGPCANKNPCYAAVGVDAYDDGGNLYFTLSRNVVTADRVSFELRNHDSQSHNLFVQERGKDSTIKPVVANLPPGPGGTTTRATAEIALAPGTYTLRCVIPGHETMTVDFTVLAPR